MVDFVPVISVVSSVALILGLIGLNILRRYLDDQKRLKLRRMVHEERMAAMAKDLPAPAGDPAAEAGLLAEEAASRPWGDASIRGVLWIRLTALCLGGFSLFGGIGMVLGFLLSPERDLRDIWAVGFIPAMAGVGLLLFYYLSRDYEERFARLEGRD